MNAYDLLAEFKNLVEQYGNLPVEICGCDQPANQVVVLNKEGIQPIDYFKSYDPSKEKEPPNFIADHYYIS